MITYNFYDGGCIRTRNSQTEQLSRHSLRLRVIAEFSRFFDVEFSLVVVRCEFDNFVYDEFG